MARDKTEYQRQWRKRNPDKCQEYNDRRNREAIREKAWLRRYGLTRKGYNDLLETQDNSCAICKTMRVGRQHTHFHVDHDHGTGRIRGLLCDLCNRGLGYFKDSPYLLEKAARYLLEEK